MSQPNPTNPSAAVTRFAPSPTGYLHVGGARTALFSWLLARHEGGRFLLRIEDTDLARSTEQATVQLLEDLRWLGLHWDNAESVVYQSKRQDIYDAVIEELIARGLAYKAYDTREELDALRKEAEQQKRQFIYRRRDVPQAQLEQYEKENRPHVVRFATPLREWRFHDAVLDKEIVQPVEEVQDFVIRKQDGMPTYHFAVVIDDAAMGVTHILRGQEHTKNTFNHISLQEALGYPRPVYGHLPIIMNLDGSKMGKRDRDKKIRQRIGELLKAKKFTTDQITAAARLAPSRLDEWLKNDKSQLDIPEQAALMHVIGLQESDLPEILVHDFRKNGYLAEALLNFLALLGWSPGGDLERMSMEEMIQRFSIGGINKGNAKFDRTKLLAFNTEACASASPHRLLTAMRDYLVVNPESPLNAADDAALSAVLHMKKGFRLLREVDESTRFFFIRDEEVNYDPDAVEKILRKSDNAGLNVLRSLSEVLTAAPEWTATSLESTVKQYCDTNGLGLGKVAQPLRVAISGSTVSPPIFESLEFLGKEKTVARIAQCIAIAEGPH